MGSKTRLGSYCTKRANSGVNLVTSRNINMRLACPIEFHDGLIHLFYNVKVYGEVPLHSRTLLTLLVSSGMNLSTSHDATLLTDVAETFSDSRRGRHRLGGSSCCRESDEPGDT